MSNTGTRRLGTRIEQRAHPRVSLRHTVQLQHPGGPQLAELVDLSLGGSAVSVSDPPPEGIPVNVAIEFEGLGRLDIPAYVLRTGPVVGLRFARLSPNDLHALHTLIDSHQSAQRTLH